ncbi:MAG: serine/threonine protein kinase, partial [Longispora sp.]|nr:serine/threonine protein kinase [Longispora sp. (in: high G+C Gram-positive bacteria)]
MRVLQRIVVTLAVVTVGLTTGLSGPVQAHDWEQLPEEMVEKVLTGLPTPELLATCQTVSTDLRRVCASRHVWGDRLADLSLQELRQLTALAQLDSDLAALVTAEPGRRMCTIAGDGQEGFGGDTGPAAAARLNRPAAVAADAHGNVFIADEWNNRIRKIDPQGVISTLAGTDHPGFSGDGGPATAAHLNYPLGVAVDAHGNVFIADAGNHRIRKIDLHGVITTIAGDGEKDFDGDGGPAIAAQLGFPSAVAVDAHGNVFIADTDNNRIRKIDLHGVITTVAGTNLQGFGGDNGPAFAAQLNQPTGIAVDARGSVFVADTGNNRIRKIDPYGVITTIAGGDQEGFDGDGKPATVAQLNGPQAVAVDARGSVFVADTGNHRIRKI